MMYGMQKTTVYLPEELKQALERLAAQTGASEAELVRESVRRLILEDSPPAPELPLFGSGEPRLADRVDELLRGFGRR